MLNIDQIIAELYEIDPTLKEHDAAIRKIITEFVAKKPDTKFDKAFAAKLRARLIEEAGKSPASPAHEPIPSPYWNLQRSFMALGGVLLAILILVVFLPNGTPASPGAGQHFTTEGKGSFGELAFNGTGQERTAAVLPQANSTEDSGTSANAPAAMPQSMTMTEGSVPVSSGAGSAGAGMVAGGMGGGTSGKALIYPGPITEYAYTYVGDDFELTDKTGDVYSRVKGGNAGIAAAAQLKDFGLGLVGLGTFGSMRLGNFELAEDKADGYRISVNLDEGSISIYPNYQKWTLYNARDAQSLTQKDALSNEKIITIAEAFMKAHGIDRSIYGDPIVENNQLVPMPLGMEASSAGSPGAGAVEATPQTASAPSGTSVLTTESAPAPEPIAAPADVATPNMPIRSDDGTTTMMPFVAENASVIFPLKIGGTTVYEEGGALFGLQVNVSVRGKKVESVYNLVSQDYTKSSYDLITDRAKLLEIIRSQNGMNNFYRPEGVTIQTVEIKLGTPTKVLVHHYEYNGTDTKELFVPALMFPVVGSPNTPAGGNAYYYPGYYPKAILVPLVVDFLKSNNPQPVIMY